MIAPRLLATSLALVACLAPTALAKTHTFDTVSEALAEAREGKIKRRDLVEIRRVTVTAAPAQKDDLDYIYVNDRDRDGDGLLFSYPTYWASGADPFDEDSEDPFDDVIVVPEFKRGWEISVSGFLEERDDGRGWHLFRPGIDNWNNDEEFYDFEVDKAGTDDETRTIRAVFTIHAKEALALPRRPSRVRVLPSMTVRPGQLLVVSARDVGERGRILWDGKTLETHFDRRPGILMARVPSDASNGTHRLVVRNPQVGNSRSVRIRVIAPTPPPLPAPELTRVRRVGDLLILEGEHFKLAGTLRVQLGNRDLSVISRDGTSIVAAFPAGASATSKVKVKLDTRSSAAVSIDGSSSGITGGLTGN